MADEIDTTAQLIEVAELRQVVIHELAGTRDTSAGLDAPGLPPDELHAPGSPDDDAAVSFCTRLEDDQLGVRCRIETCNSHGYFVVDGEAIFFLPAPVSRDTPEIVREFTEQVGALAVFPYVRSAVASLAAQMSIPASPLPLLHAGDVTLTQDDEPVAEQEPPELFMHGMVTRTTDDGPEEIAEFFVDQETGLLSRFGGEGQTPDLDELLNAIAELPPPEEMTWEWMIRQRGEVAVRQSIESLRPGEGDASTDAVLAEIDQAVAHIAAEDAFVALNEAIHVLSVSAKTARKSFHDSDGTGPADDSDVPMTLLEAAERVRDCWDRVHATLTSEDD